MISVVKELSLSRLRTILTPLECSQLALQWVHKESLTQEETIALNQEVLSSFRDYVNLGFLRYRKSVTSGGTLVP